MTQERFPTWLDDACADANFRADVERVLNRTLVSRLATCGGHDTRRFSLNVRMNERALRSVI